MRLKSFHAANIAEAMRQVREMLGDDAIIVATRQEADGVRITAAIEQLDTQPLAATTTAAHPGISTITQGGPETPDLSEIISDALHRQGVPAALADRLMDAAIGIGTNDLILTLAGALDRIFQFKPLPEGQAARPLMLVGPPGSGKTLTVAKLAARSVLGGHSVGVITTDTVRAGGVQQLAAFTSLLKIKLLTVEDAACLDDAIQVLSKCEVVLVDAPGRNPFDAADMADQATFLAGDAVEPVLVLPAGMDAVDAVETARTFRALGVQRLLLTRLDIARRIGPMLAAAHEAGFDFCDGTASPTVATGLVPLNPVELARLLLPPQPADAHQDPEQDQGYAEPLDEDEAPVPPPEPSARPGASFFAAATSSLKSTGTRR